MIITLTLDVTYVKFNFICIYSMKTIVLGSGVIGVTTAYYLAKYGADVTVIDRCVSPAQETSYANAGQISPGYSTPWAAPGVPLKAIKWLLQKHSPLSFKPDGTMFQLKWIAQMLRNCSSDRYAVNKERMMRLSEYSRICLANIRRDTGIEYEQGLSGTLQLFRSQAQMDSVHRDIQVLQECNVPYELISADHLTDVEPGLSKATHKLAGGLRLPNDETGNCQMFTEKLAKLASEAGVKFRFNETVKELIVEGNLIAGVLVSNLLLQADRYVLAFGSYSRDLLVPLKLDLPVYPVKGYSLTVPIVNHSLAPRSTVLDETFKVAVTRLGSHIRVGGMAELSGFDLSLNPRRRATLEHVVNDLFPGGDTKAASFWTGLRPMTPDSTPLIGSTPYTNLFLNTGHGTLGWTMACGAGKILADTIIGKSPDISMEGFGLNR